MAQPVQIALTSFWNLRILLSHSGSRYYDFHYFPDRMKIIFALLRCQLILLRFWFEVSLRFKFRFTQSLKKRILRWWLSLRRVIPQFFQLVATDPTFDQAETTKNRLLKRQWVGWFTRLHSGRNKNCFDLERFPRICCCLIMVPCPSLNSEFGVF